MIAGDKTLNYTSFSLEATTEAEEGVPILADVGLKNEGSDTSPGDNSSYSSEIDEKKLAGKKRENFSNSESDEPLAKKICKNRIGLVSVEETKGELGDSDLSPQLSNFTGALSNQPVNCNIPPIEPSHTHTSMGQNPYRNASFQEKGCAGVSVAPGPVPSYEAAPIVFFQSTNDLTSYPCKASRPSPNNRLHPNFFPGLLNWICPGSKPESAFEAWNIILDISERLYKIAAELLPESINSEDCEKLGKHFYPLQSNVQMRLFCDRDAVQLFIYSMSVQAECIAGDQRSFIQSQVQTVIERSKHDLDIVENWLSSLSTDQSQIVCFSPQT